MTEKKSYSEKEQGDAVSPLFQKSEEERLLKTLTPVLISKEGVSLYLDTTPFLAKRAFFVLQTEFEEMTHLLSFAFVVDGKIVALLSWTDYRPNHDMWWTIVSTNPSWCTKKVLTYLFQTAKNYFKTERINALTKTNNLKAVSLLSRLGFEKEGRLKRFYQHDKQDAYIWAKFL